MLLSVLYRVFLSPIFYSSIPEFDYIPVQRGIAWTRVDYKLSRRAILREALRRKDNGDCELYS